MSQSKDSNDNRDDTPKGVKTVFVIAKQCPKNSTTYSIGKAVERITGVSCYGAQERAGLWRIQTYTEVGRIKLLAGSFVMDGRKVTVHDKNPYLRGDVDDDDPSTKLTISGLPFSYGNEAIDKNLIGMGIKLRTKIQHEFARDYNGHLCDYRTGRRTVWINIPDNPLERKVKMGNFQAELFHWEMKQNSMQCRKCLQYGHKAAGCQNEEVCLLCKIPGHRRGECTDKQAQHEEQQTSFKAPWQNAAQTRGNTPCTLCGSVEHNETSIDCQVAYPPMAKCTECDETDHVSGAKECFYYVPEEEMQNTQQQRGATPNNTNMITSEVCTDCQDTDHSAGDEECYLHNPYQILDKVTKDEEDLLLAQREGLTSAQDEEKDDKEEDKDNKEVAGQDETEERVDNEEEEDQYEDSKEDINEDLENNTEGALNDEEGEGNKETKEDGTTTEKEGNKDVTNLLNNLCIYTNNQSSQGPGNEKKNDRNVTFQNNSVSCSPDTNSKTDQGSRLNKREVPASSPDGIAREGRQAKGTKLDMDC